MIYDWDDDAQAIVATWHGPFPTEADAKLAALSACGSWGNTAVVVVEGFITGRDADGWYWAKQKDEVNVRSNCDRP